MSAKVLFWLAVSVIFEVVGDVLTRSAAGRTNPFWWLAALVTYNAMLVSWLFAVNAAELIAVPGLIWLIGGSTAVVLVGCLGFHERVTSWQIIGIVLAAISMVFLSM